MNKQAITGEISFKCFQNKHCLLFGDIYIYILSDILGRVTESVFAKKSLHPYL